MTNPLVETVQEELGRVGIRGAILIEERYDPESFGNAEAVYEIGGLRFRFVRDRGQDGVDIIVPGSSDSFVFEDLSVAMGWQELNDIVNTDAEIDFGKPPSGPIPLRVVLEYMRHGMSDLQAAFSSPNTSSTLKKLRDAQAKRTKTMFG
ncbi:MAG TPA: hypothetical protein VMM76_08255 [Pirellulaceae bacterium]|nr:hypothetical protein [Pirellulaceae bacterium]